MFSFQSPEKRAPSQSYLFREAKIVERHLGGCIFRSLPKGNKSSRTQAIPAQSRPIVEVLWNSVLQSQCGRLRLPPISVSASNA
jgi:hypothetical protein